MILSANHKQNNWQNMLIHRGQLITSYDSLALGTGLTVQNVRTGCNKLKSTGEITIKSTNRFSLITIVKYDEYQVGVTSKSTRNLTNNQQTTNKQLTTNNNDNNDNNEINNNVPLRDTSQSNWKPVYGEQYINGFNKLFGGSYRVTPARTNKLKARFKSYTSEEITKALYNLSKSKFHRGDNDTGWKATPDFLIRNDETVDKWLNFTGEKYGN